MKITLKLFSNLAEHLPAQADGNALEIDAGDADAITPRMLIERYRLPPAEAKVMMLNGAHLPPEQHDAPLRDGDVLAVWPSIQGG
ncbi:MAG: MoaD/ThiS family protein [bacterium]